MDQKIDDSKRHLWSFSTTRFFFTSNTFFLFSLIVARLELGTLYFVYLCLCLRLGLFTSYLCELFFIFFKINHKISLKKGTLDFWNNFVKISAWGCCLASCLIFVDFGLLFLIKVLLIKKHVISDFLVLSLKGNRN